MLTKLKRGTGKGERLEEEEEEEREEEEEEICKLGCTFIIYMVKKIDNKIEKEDF